jgi:hypothetical protein
VTDDLRVLIGKDGGAIDMAVVMVGVDNRFDRFPVEDIVQVGIEGILDDLCRRNALPWIDDNQAIAALDQCRVVSIVPSGNVDAVCYLITAAERILYVSSSVGWTGTVSGSYGAPGSLPRNGRHCKSQMTTRPELKFCFHGFLLSLNIDRCTVNVHRTLFPYSSFYLSP